MKIYTKTGDAGETSLFGNSRVSKADARVDAYGEVDELNACLGAARAAGLDAELSAMLEVIQKELFAIGARLADPSHSIAARVTKADIVDAQVARLEAIIDRLEGELPALRRFILPGGGPAGATLHLARTVCRRAERLCVKLAREETVDPASIKFLNRLSDALFVWARWVAKKQGEPEFLWERAAAPK